jgi:uncharacterized secreted protein with C-terminal beta-propeller domain
MVNKLIFSAIAVITVGMATINAQEYYYIQNGKRVDLQPLLSSMRSTNIEENRVQFYQKQNTQVVGVDDTIIVKLHTDYSIKNLLQKNPNIFLVKKLTPTLYLLRVDNARKTLEIANALNQQEGVVFSQPNFLKKSFKR